MPCRFCAIPRSFVDMDVDELPTVLGVTFGVSGELVKHMLCAPWCVLANQVSAPLFSSDKEAAGLVPRDAACRSAMADVLLLGGA